MKSAMKKVLSLTLALVLLIGVFPMAAFAAENDKLVEVVGGGRQNRDEQADLIVPIIPDEKENESEDDDEIANFGRFPQNGQQSQRPEVQETVTVKLDYAEGAEEEGYMPTYTITKGSSLGDRLPENPQRNGLTFKGWFAGNNKVDSDTPIYNDVTLVAKWEAQQYTLTLDENRNEEELVNSVKRVTYGKAVGELRTPSRDGYTFKGWFDRNGKEYTAKTIYNVVGDTTVYAKWEANRVPNTPMEPAIPTNKHTLTLNANGGNVEPETIEVNHGGMVENLPVPTRRGYEFLGWYTRANGGDVVKVITNMSGDRTIYAHWKELNNNNQGSNRPGNNEDNDRPGNNEGNDRPNREEKFNVYVNLNYDRKMGETQKYISEGTKMSEVLRNVDEPTRKGYKFVGWYWDENCRNDVEKNDKVLKDCTIYAKWEKKNVDHEVLLKIYLNGHTGSAVKVVDMDAYDNDGKITLSEVSKVVKKYYEVKSGHDDMDIDGLFTADTWNNGRYNMKKAENTIRVENGKDTYIYVMVRDAQKITSSSSVADSSNPKTGDMIMAPAIVLGASVTCLAVLFFLNKKRAVK